MRYRLVAFGLVFTIACCFVTNVRAGAVSDFPTTPAGLKLQKIWLDGFHRFLKDAPEAGTFLGDYSHDGELSEPGLAGLRKGEAAVTRFEKAIKKVDDRI